MAAAASADDPPTSRTASAAFGVAVTVEARDERSNEFKNCQPLDEGRLAGLAAAVLLDEGVDIGELGLRFVDPGDIADLNLNHMGHEGPTDVLAFPLDGDGVRGGPHPPGVSPLLGDVVVCPALASAQATGHACDDHDGSMDDELALLVVHGVLHVLGYDHAEDADAADMQARERRLLAAHHRQP